MKKTKTTAPEAVENTTDQPRTPEAESVSPPPLDPETSGPEPELEEMKSKLAKAEETWDRLLRTTAEFDNFRKRAAREKEEAIRYANLKLLERLLPVLDSFNMAATAVGAPNGGESADSLKEGIDLVHQQLRSVLREAGLEEIEALGKPFDPNFHEAVSQMETADFEEGTVAQQLRKGYVLRDRLVRPSTVIVAKKPAA